MVVNGEEDEREAWHDNRDGMEEVGREEEIRELVLLPLIGKGKTKQNPRSLLERFVRESHLAFPPFLPSSSLPTSSYARLSVFSPLRLSRALIPTPPPPSQPSQPSTQSQSFLSNRPSLISPHPSSSKPSSTTKPTTFVSTSTSASQNQNQNHATFVPVPGKTVRTSDGREIDPTTLHLKVRRVSSRRSLRSFVVSIPSCFVLTETSAPSLTQNLDPGVEKEDIEAVFGAYGTVLS